MFTYLTIESDIKTLTAVYMYIHQPEVLQTFLEKPVKNVHNIPEKL